MSVTQIREQIIALNEAERAELSNWLADSSLADRLDPDVETESVRIADERLEGIESGKIEEFTEEEFWKRAAAQRAQ